MLSEFRRISNVWRILMYNEKQKKLLGYSGINACLMSFLLSSAYITTENPFTFVLSVFFAIGGIATYLELKGYMLVAKYLESFLRYAFGALGIFATTVTGFAYFDHPTVYGFFAFYGYLITTSLGLFAWFAVWFTENCIQKKGSLK